ncbi:MAG: AAA family ATPase [Candidatus Nanohaloarchaea archaeon]
MWLFGGDNGGEEDDRVPDNGNVDLSNPHGDQDPDLRYRGPLSLDEARDVLNYVETRATSPYGGFLEGYRIEDPKTLPNDEVLYDEDDNLKAATAVWLFDYTTAFGSGPSEEEIPEEWQKSDSFPPAGKVYTHIYGFEFPTGERGTEFYTFPFSPEALEHNDIERQLGKINDHGVEEFLEGDLTTSLSSRSSIPTGSGSKKKKKDAEEEIPVGEAYDPEGYTWDDLGADEELKQTLIENIQNPLEAPELFDRAGVEPDGVILYGPPGTGKTLSTKIAASQADATVIEASGADIFDSLVGESEGNVQDLYQVARQNAPSMILLDEIDALTQARSGGANEARYGVVNQMLSEIDGLNESENPVLTVGTTNRLDQVDPAFMRGGRLGMQIEMPEPTYGAREEIFQIKTTTDPEGAGVLVSNNIDYEELAEATDGFTGADIEKVVQEAAKTNINRVLRENDDPEPEEHLEDLRVGMSELAQSIDSISEEDSDDSDGGPTGRSFQ